VDARADPPLLRGSAERRRLGLRLWRGAGLADQLVHGGHAGISILVLTQRRLAGVEPRQPLGHGSEGSVAGQTSKPASGAKLSGPFARFAGALRPPFSWLQTIDLWSRRDYSQSAPATGRAGVE